MGTGGLNLDLTPEEVSRLLHAHFRRIDEVCQLVDNAAAWPVEPMSSLAQDDELSAPHQVSHAVHRQIHVASDHLHAVRLLLTGEATPTDRNSDGGIIHVYADYTLIRAAIEAASTGLWLLGPAVRTERIGRVLALMRQDAFDAAKAMEPRHREAAAAIIHSRRDEVRAIAERANIPVPDFRPTFRGIVEEASTRAVSTAFLSWQICSGMAHGRFWSFRALSEIEEVLDHGESVTIRSTGNLQGVLVMVSDAVLVLNHLIKLLDSRRRKHDH